MNKILVLKLAGSAVVLGATLVGCNPAAKQSAIASASDAGGSARSASSAAAKAEKALKANDSVAAIASAEAAVAAQPRQASYRMLLGQAYLAGGRFVSAETAFLDTLRLDPGNDRAGLSLALAQIALGRPDIARDTLDKTAANVPVADRGLALALAGDIHGAVELLEPAARAEGASGKTRQNLALAYALGGDWSRARVIAAQDIPADELDRRLSTWASFTQPRNSWDQVATLLGVKAVLDRGQPERLALAPDAAPERQALAAATPEQMFAPTAAESGDAAAVQDAAPVEIAEAPQAAATLRQVVFAPRQEVVQAIPAGLIRANNGPLRQVMAARGVPGGRFVVQLGAFSTPAKAEAAWKRAVGRYTALGGYAPDGETVRSGSATLHRVAAGGFASRGAANAVCAQLRMSGGACFVREDGNQPQAQWAMRAAGGMRIAAR
ncbi:SPOR domain-containing protein [Sphingomonas colocasiae]|uniref:SPOR domain-containing protein n=1 Tax=Sphingomonas colocasiae TaxID=1848973 RepID=A0ABS7PIK3_9SPHN|nr:SPOR domain-containing protein [Sphingomonas colocasiae]MBY8821116.1 SPOR domain-containing protein [Sphingomonas colocasiae]